MQGRLFEEALRTGQVPADRLWALGLSDVEIARELYRRHVAEANRAPAPPSAGATVDDDLPADSVDSMESEQVLAGPVRD